MNMKRIAMAASGVFLTIGAVGAAQAKCSSAPIRFNGNSAEIEWALTVQAGTSCMFSVGGIDGAITEVKITQQPKVGKAGVENLKPYYVAKAGYQGADEFTYAFIGTDQYGGPMKVAIKRKVTIVP